MKLIVTGSIAFDYLMSFPGRFAEHFPAGTLQGGTVNFMVETMDKRRGGCAPNIAYTLALLGERPFLMGTAGQDFGDYREWLEGAGIDTSFVRVVPDKFTASFFSSADVENNRIASFYSGAMAHASELSFRRIPGATLAVISPNDPRAMRQYAAECRELKIPYIFDPGPECGRLAGEELRGCLTGARIVIGNAAEFDTMRHRTGMTDADLLAVADLLVVTRGEEGSSLIQGDTRVDVRAVAPARLVDRTGVGDAFRGGFIKGLAEGAPYTVCAQLGSVAAAYALEHVGAMAHLYSLDDFKERYDAHYGPLTL